MFDTKRVALSVAFVCSSSAMAQTYQGELQVLVFDNFNNHKTKIVYKLKEGNEVYTLDLPSSVNKQQLLSGQQVYIEGMEYSSLPPKKSNEEVEKVIKVDSLLPKNAAMPSSLNGKAREDKRIILTMIINFSDVKTTAKVTKEDVDSILYTSPLSTLKNIKRSSFGQVSFVRDVNNDGKPSITVVNLNYPLSQTCDYQQWESDAKTAAARSGFNLSTYRHFMLVLPEKISCDWGGLGSLGCGSSCTTWIRGYDPKLVYSQLIYTHELGHNLGMSHSATDTNNDGVVESEYGDSACIMGTGNFQFYSEVNAAHRDQMGWYASMPNRVKLVTTDGQFTLSALEAGTDNNGLIVLKIPRNSTETYYVSYRKNIGPFGFGDPSYTDKVSIHRTVAGNARTYFIRMLKAGESFVDTKTNISVTAVKTSDIAVVNVRK